jgi:hypothetical protein
MGKNNPQRLGAMGIIVILKQLCALLGGDD